MANLIVSAVSTFDNKGLRKGKKELTAFEQTVNKLGKTFASVFAAQKLLAFSKRAVTAFMEDEKAAKSLEIQLRNTGNAFAIPSVEYYIANLQKVTGVLDDQLRPAFQQLLTVTGSITKSQEALNTALNVSAATGRSLTEVSAALTRGFSGNTTGLSRLGAGISKATLKTGDMDKILGELNKKFAGQSQARLTTYAGKMDLLTVAAEDARETIGKGLLDAISLIGKDTGITTATNSMQNFAQSTADAIVGVGVLISKLKEMGNTKVGSVLFDVKNIPVLGAYLAGFAEIGAAQRNKPTSNFTYGLGSSATKDIERVKEITRLKTSNKLRQDEINKMKAKSEVDKLEEKFNVERIALMKALGEATDAETKLRIQSKLAILDNNEALAKKYLAEVNAAKAATDLASAFNSSAPEFKAAVETIARLKTTLPDLLARVQAGAATFNGGGIPSSSMPSSASTAAAAAASTVVPQVTVNTGAVLTNNQDLERYIQDAIGNVIKLGNGVVPRGSVVLLQ